MHGQSARRLQGSSWVRSTRGVEAEVTRAHTPHEGPLDPIDGRHDGFGEHINAVH